MDENSERLEQFRHEIDRLGLSAPGDAGERRWQVAGTALIVAAFAMVLIGWYGASGTAALHEQIPYVISGGLMGVVLAAVGGAILLRSSMTRYLRFWFIRMIYEERVQTDRVVASLEKLSPGESARSGSSVGEDVGAAG
ncbi:MAG: hypothetical protein JJU45_11035 [Acidimicrobiia bacterium]|nr:hypothetical protein [Acidimicrobiia bacterium]